MWTNDNRARYDRSRLRYPSNPTDAEWVLIAPLISSAKRGGNKGTVNEREIANGLMYILSTGCQWAALPKDLPPAQHGERLFPALGPATHPFAEWSESFARPQDDLGWTLRAKSAPPM